MEEGRSTAINYLGYKFLLFCKVSTQPLSCRAGWLCSGETQQRPQQLLMLGTGREGPEREAGGCRGRGRLQGAGRGSTQGPRLQEAGGPHLPALLAALSHGSRRSPGCPPLPSRLELVGEALNLNLLICRTG